MCENITFIVHNWHCVDALSVAPHKRDTHKDSTKGQLFSAFLLHQFLIKPDKRGSLSGSQGLLSRETQSEKKGQCLAFFRNIMRMNGKPLKHDNRKSFLAWLPAYKDDTIFDFFLLQTLRTITLYVCLLLTRRTWFVIDWKLILTDKSNTLEPFLCRMMLLFFFL